MCKVSRAICLLALAAIFAVSGCKSTPTLPEPVPEQPPPVPPTMAEESLRLAQATDDRVEKARHYLDALESLHAPGEAEHTAQIVRRMFAEDFDGATLADTLTEERRYRLDAIRLDLAIDAGDEGELRRLLAGLDRQGTEPAPDAMGLRARVQSAVGDIAGAARTMIALVELTTEPNAVSDLSAAIWRHLSQMPILELRARAATAPTATAREWWLLAAEVNSAVTNRGRSQRWHRWQSRHPHHPAARHPPPTLVQVARDPSRLALLVPVSGDFGPAGEAVRDGFLAAYLHAGAASQRIRIYDTNVMSVGAAYDLARREGAEVIIGPLQREAVRALSALSPTLPVIALNHLDAGVEAAETMTQFSLAIEDQASAIADALASEGIERIVLFDSPARWSARARARLEDELEGVEAVGAGTFYRLAEVTKVVGDAFHISASQTRAREISSLLGTTFEFAPRRRDDVDAVVALIDADEYLSLKPALDFHFAGNLPVFAPSTAALGSVDLARLDGLRVCAMPWTLDGGALGKAVNDAFPGSRGSYASLFALGVDGFRLANQLERLTVRREPIPGSTGVLTLGEGGRIQRTLIWAEVTGGRLVPLLDRND